MRRWVLRRERMRAGLVVLLASATVGCGARTSLDGPSPRDASAVLPAVAPTTQCVLVTNSESLTWASTWTFSSAGWTRLMPPSAPSAWFAGTATLNGDVVSFGGFGYSNNTWVWSGQSWTSLAPSPAPSPRMQFAMAALDGKVLVFGGLLEGVADPSETASASDTWQWDGSSWTQLSPVTSPKDWSGAVAATLGLSVVLFGGVVDSYLDNDTWEWHGTDWTQDQPSMSPTPRESAVAATLGENIILFGGEDGDGHTLGDTWVWNGTTWTELTPPNSPPGRYLAVAGTLGSSVVVAGGYGADSATLLDDTWTWDGTSWTERAGSGPSAGELTRGSMSCR